MDSVRLPYEESLILGKAAGTSASLGTSVGFEIFIGNLKTKGQIRSN